MKAIVLSLIAAAVVPPCIWDSDTLDTELRGLPDAFDLVVGRWHRHGEAYYRDRLARLGGKNDLTLAEWDDLAVAHEHLGDQDAAIAAMARKAELLARNPDHEHRYRYLANLGTFHAHAGRYDEALTALRAAIELEPNAHFGRERFQIEAIEYVSAAQRDPGLWRQHSFLRHAGYRMRDLGQRVTNSEPHDELPEGQPFLTFGTGYQAIGGMIRYGGREGAELYRALGELFLSEMHLNLSWWSLRRAIERGHPAHEDLQRTLAGIERHWRESAAHTPVANPIPDAELYARMRANADAWVAAFQRLEAAAIARGEDVRGDAALQSLLAAADHEVPRLTVPTPRWPWTTWAGLFLIGYVVFRLGAFAFRRRQRGR